MARKKLPDGEKKEVIQALLKGSDIEKLGGKKKCAAMCTEFLASEVKKLNGE